eukprot:7354697-Pyramimonas_sp.AAC.1
MIDEDRSFSDVIEPMVGGWMLTWFAQAVLPENTETEDLDDDLAHQQMQMEDDPLDGETGLSEEDMTELQR